VLTALGIIALATAVVRFGGAEVLKRWWWPSNLFEEFYAGSLAPPVDPSAFRDVRIIVITDRTADAIDSLARGEQLQGISAANWISVRRLHGRMMEKLADAGVRTVVWDIRFPNASEFDGDFVRGVKDVQKSPRGGVVVGAQIWELPGGKPEMSPEILNAGVLWGGATVNFGPHAFWRMDLMVQHEGQTPILSLDMHALSAWHNPSEYPSVEFNKQDGTIQLQYGAGAGLGEEVSLSTVQTASGTKEENDAGIVAGDLVGQYVLELPPDDVLKPVQLEYQDVLRASKEERERWFGGRLVLIGDYRTTKNDIYKAPDGRMINGPTAHAIVMDQLLRGVSIRYARGYGYFGMIAAGAGLGVAAIWLSAGRRRLCALMLIAGAGIVIVMSIVAFRSFNVLCNPLLPAVAMLLAAGAFAMVDRARRLPDNLRFNRRVGA
jgi:hypothetical protein